MQRARAALVGEPLDGTSFRSYNVLEWSSGCFTSNHCNPSSLTVDPRCHEQNPWRRKSTPGVTSLRGYAYPGGLPNLLRTSSLNVPIVKWFTNGIVLDCLRNCWNLGLGSLMSSSLTSDTSNANSTGSPGSGFFFSSFKQSPSWA